MVFTLFTPVIGLYRGIAARRSARANSLATLADSDTTLTSSSIICDSCGHQVAVPRSPMSPPQSPQFLNSPSSFNSDTTAVNSPASPTAPQAPFLRYRLKDDASTPILQFYLFVAQAAEGLEEWVLTDVAVCHNNGRRPTGGENWRSESEGYRELLVMRFKNVSKKEPIEDEDDAELNPPLSRRRAWRSRITPTPRKTPKPHPFHPSNNIVVKDKVKDDDLASLSGPTPTHAPRMRYPRAHLVVERNLSLSTNPEEEDAMSPVFESGESTRFSIRTSPKQENLLKSSAISLTPSFISVSPQ